MKDAGMKRKYCGYVYIKNRKNYFVCQLWRKKTEIVVKVAKYEKEE
jgi:hypothetical protein